jgi:hypothetical protein
MLMRPVNLDKIASVTQNCRLSREVRVGDEIRCQEGDVLAVRVLSSKATYNLLELVTGRLSTLRPGDVIAGALGHRHAVFGYAGHVPESLAVGDTVNILNQGGVLGICDSASADLGPPFECEVLGSVLHFPYVGERIGVPASIAQGLPGLDDHVECDGVPVIAVAGTCMNSGKTVSCAALIQELTRARRRVHAAKTTGISMRRDVLAMEDAGAAETMVFTDLGTVTTSPSNAAALTRTMLNRLARAEVRPDAIVLELGDGLLGKYGVDSILADERVRSQLGAVVLAANDPVGAWGGVRRLQEEFGITAAAVTGPATDNSAGVGLIETHCGVPAANARVDAARLARIVWEAATGAGSDS